MWSSVIFLVMENVTNDPLLVTAVELKVSDLCVCSQDASSFSAADRPVTGVSDNITSGCSPCISFRVSDDQDTYSVV